MFKKAIGKVTINGMEVPIFYRNGTFYVFFKKLRCALCDEMNKNYDRVLKNIGLIQNEDFLLDTVEGYLRKGYFLTEDGVIKYISGLSNISDKDKENYIFLVRNNIMKCRNMIEPNRALAQDAQEVQKVKEKEEDFNGDATEENKVNDFDSLESMDKMAEDGGDYGSYVAALLSNSLINQDNIIQRLNIIEQKIDYLGDLDEKVDYLNKQLKGLANMINSGNFEASSSEVEDIEPPLNMKILFDTLAIISSSLSSYFNKNHMANCRNATIRQADACRRISDQYYEMLTEEEKKINEKIKLVG